MASDPLPTHAKTLTLTLATFSDGGWFGVAGAAPGGGGALPLGDLIEPSVQVSMDGGVSWATVAHTSDYLEALAGHTIGGGANPNPTSVTTVFTLSEPATGITGIRIIGQNGGNAGPDPNGFIGVFELEVEALPGNSPQPTLLLNPAASGAQFRFEFDSQVGITHVVRSRASLTEDWQVHATIAGDGTRKTVSDDLGEGARFYQVTSE